MLKVFLGRVLEPQSKKKTFSSKTVTDLNFRRREEIEADLNNEPSVLNKIQIFIAFSMCHPVRF